MLPSVSIRHLAWILTDSSLIQESDLAMSSSGKMAADKHKSRNQTTINSKTITMHKLTTNPNSESALHMLISVT